MCIATHYGKSGFIGELIVHTDQRSKGLGATLLKHAIAYLKNIQAETIYLDGVLKAVPLYERHSFHKVYRSWRFSGNLVGKSSKNVRPMEADDLKQVYALDREAFGADRSFFIRRRMEIYPELCYVMEDGEKICGYITGRDYPERLYAGPWIVEDKIENPQDLLLSLALQARGRPINIGVLDANLKACDLVRSLGFDAREDSPWRMALGWPDDLGTSPTCLAIGSAAKG
jgi:ribosomal protein S18 acetylase RimI-like enzyme